MNAPAIWIHQFNRLRGFSANPNHALEGIARDWPGPLYVKALDGITYMAAFDPGRGADGPPGRDGAWTWDQLHASPWIVPTAQAPASEGGLAAAIAQAAGSVILDLEPYEHFWHGNRRDEQAWITVYSQITDAPVAISLDHRRLAGFGFPGPGFLGLATRILPQCYWTTFQRPWLEVLQEARENCAPIERPIEYVLPGDSEPQDLQDAIGWCHDQGADFSVWVWQTIRPENWDILRTALAEPQDPAPAEAVDDELSSLIVRLGYLQGDVAQAIRAPLEGVLKLVPPPARHSRGTLRGHIRALVQEALAAVNTLESEGR